MFTISGKTTFSFLGVFSSVFPGRYLRTEIHIFQPICTIGHHLLYGIWNIRAAMGASPAFPPATAPDLVPNGACLLIYIIEYSKRSEFK